MMVSPSEGGIFVHAGARVAADASTEVVSGVGEDE